MNYREFKKCGREKGGARAHELGIRPSSPQVGTSHAISYTCTPLDYPGASDTGAFGIDDAGTIVGFYYDASGNSHGFLATPVPASPFLPGPGLVGLAATKRKFKK